MIQLLLFHGEDIYEPVVTNLVWETHRKGRAGSLQFTILEPNPPRVQYVVEIGDFVELYSIDDHTNEKKKILRYQIFSRERTANEYTYLAYCQLYHLAHSRESMIIEPVSFEIILPFMKNHSFYALYDNSFATGDTKDFAMAEMSMKWKSFTEREKGELIHFDTVRREDVSRNAKDFGFGVVPSDLIYYFCRRYHLTPSSIAYYDMYRPKKSSVEWGLTGRVADKESPLDIIQSYMDRNLIFLGEMFILYDGSDGIIYKPMEDMRTYLHFESNSEYGNIMEYSIREELPKDYFNMIDFAIAWWEKSDGGTNQGKKVLQRQNITYIPNQSAVEKLGIFHTYEEIVQDRIEEYKGNLLGIKVLKNVRDVLVERKLYYDDLSSRMSTKMELKNVLGHWDVRGGSIISIDVPTVDGKRLCMEVLVERAIHTYRSKADHTMSLDLFKENVVA